MLGDYVISPTISDMPGTGIKPPSKALTDLEGIGGIVVLTSANAFIQAAKADVLPCWDSLVIRLLSQHINLGLLRKEVGCKLQACI